MHAGNTVACSDPCLIWATFKRSYPQPHNIRSEHKIGILVYAMQYNKSAIVYDTNEDNG